VNYVTGARVGRSADATHSPKISGFATSRPLDVVVAVAEGGAMDPGLAGTLATAVWCLHRFYRLEREHVARRGPAARLRALALSWCTAAVVLSGASACIVAAARVASPGAAAAAATLYLGGCALALGLLIAVEGLVAAYRLRRARDAAVGERRRSVRTLMRAAPDSELRL